MIRFTCRRSVFGFTEWITPCCIAVALCMTLPVFAVSTSRIIISPSGVQVNGEKKHPAISADGRYVAFEGQCGYVDRCGAEGIQQICVADLRTGAVTVVSVSGNGAQGDRASYAPAISADGTCIAFESSAGNLVANDTNGKRDVFVRNLSTGVTTRVSVSGVAQGNGDSVAPSINGDGSVVAFESTASNLVAGDTNGKSDIFVRNVTSGSTTRVSVTGSGAQANGNSNAPSISADGAWVAFESLAANLVAGDTNGKRDIFLRRLSPGSTTRVSVTGSGAQGNGYAYAPSISGDGRYIVFESNATNLVSGDANCKWDVFMRDRIAGTTMALTAGGNGDSIAASISPDGTCVTFESNASNLVTGDTNRKRDIFSYEVSTGVSKRVSVATAGTQGNGDSFAPSIALYGRFIVFESAAGNLVASETNVKRELYVRDQLQAQPDLSINGVGAGVYGAPEGQTATTTVESGQAASYRLTIRNDGNLPDTITVVGNGGDAGWTVRYLNAFTGGNDVTDLVTTGGWSVGPLMNGSSAELLVEITPDGTVSRDAASNTIQVTATSAGDPLWSDSVTAATTRMALSALILNSDTPSPALLGTPIAVTAAPTGGGPVEYCFFISVDGGEYTLVQPYGPNGTCSYLPTAPGTYTILAYGREVGSPNAYDTAISRTFVVTAPPITALAVTATPEPPSNVNTPLSLTAVPTGGYSVEYAFLVSVDGAPAAAIRGYTADNTCAYTPTAYGTYLFEVWAREVGSTNAQDCIATLTYKIAPPITGVQLAADPPTAQGVNMPVALTATATGGSEVEYRYCVSINGGAFVELRGYATDGTFTFTPTITGNYVLRVWAREVGSTTPFDAEYTLNYAIVTPNYRADMGIREFGELLYVGNDIIGPLDGQVKTLTAAPGATAVYYLRVQNDGNLRESFRITASGNTEGWTVRIFDTKFGTNDVTAISYGEGWTTVAIIPGAYHFFRMEITPATNQPGGATCDIQITGTSVSDPTKSDTVQAHTVVPAVYRADMGIREFGELLYVGNDIIGPREGQVKTLTAAPGATAVYYLRVQNDGNSRESYRITADGEADGWTVRVFDTKFGTNDVTAISYGEGWTTVAIIPGAYHVFRMEITPDANRPAGAVCDILVTGTSVSDASKSDTVQAHTIVQ